MSLSILWLMPEIKYHWFGGCARFPIKKAAVLLHPARLAARARGGDFSLPAGGRSEGGDFPLPSPPTVYHHWRPWDGSQWGRGWGFQTRRCSGCFVLFPYLDPADFAADGFREFGDKLDDPGVLVGGGGFLDMLLQFPFQFIAGGPALGPAGIGHGEVEASLLAVTMWPRG